MDEITVVATRWGLGWELSVPGSEDPITQVATLDRARQQVIDYLDTVDPDTPHADWTVTVIPDDAALGTEIREVRAATRAATSAQESAARATRDLVVRLRGLGYRSADIAGMLGVTRSRVGQLLREAKTPA